MRFEALRSSGLPDRIRDELRSAIVGGRFAPGTVLRESLIAAEMEISRAPVREALRLLEESGLVEKSPNRSYRVAEFTEEDLRDLASLRIALEELAIRLVIGVSPPLDGVHAALAQMRVAVDAGSVPDIIGADRAFHEALVVAAGNKRLTAAYTRLRDQIQLALLTNIVDRASVLDDIVERHEDLLDRYLNAAASGDLTLIYPVLEEHITGGMKVAGNAAAEATGPAASS